MTNTWQQINQVITTDLWTRMDQFLAQAPPQFPSAPVQQSVNLVQGALKQVVDFMPRLLGAVITLIVGWLIAAIAASIVRKILNGTKIDNKIAASVTGRRDGDLPQVEKLISSLVFWTVMLFTAVAVLDTLDLQVASQPLNAFLGQISEFFPKLLGAGVFLGLAWLVATLVRTVTVRGLNALNVDERLNSPQDSTSGLNQVSLAETIGNALYWFIFLLFLVPVLDTLGLKQALLPVQSLVTQVLSILPNILGATIIGVVGWFLANIVRKIVTNLLASTGVDNLGSRVGLSSSGGAQPLSGILGTVAYALILIPVAIAALNTLQIQAISGPATSMLQQVLNTLPAIFTAGSILVVSYFLGKFAADLVTSILTSIGFNNIFSILGLPSLSKQTVSRDGENTAAVPARTPSEIAGIVVLVGIMLFATVAAVNILNIPALTTLVTGILLVMGRILSGLVVFGIGLYLANLCFRIIASSGSSQAKVLGQAARISIIALVSAMALQQIGVASDIVNLAFGLLLGAIAVAIALAFGLGGRDIAAEQVRSWLNSFNSKA
jgi:Conserved TM helix